MALNHSEMKRYILAGIALIALNVAGCASSSGKPRPTLNDLKTRYDWAPSFEAGLQKAKEKNKPAVLFFYHSLCLACRNLVLDIAADERVAELLDHYVFVAVNISSDPATRKRFRVKSVPDIRYLSPEGHEIDKLTDRSPEAVARQLERVLADLNHHEAHE